MKCTIPHFESRDTVPILHVSGSVQCYQFYSETLVVSEQMYTLARGYVITNRHVINL